MYLVKSISGGTDVLGTSLQAPAELRGQGSIVGIATSMEEALSLMGKDILDLKRLGQISPMFPPKFIVDSENLSISTKPDESVNLKWSAVKIEPNTLLNFTFNL